MITYFKNDFVITLKCIAYIPDLEKKKDKGSPIDMPSLRSVLYNFATEVPS